MISDQKLEANRQNAQKSTGPKTKRGKARAKFNASTHRYFCRDLVLTGESHDVFEHIREQMIDALVPQSMPELLIVDRIVSAMWRLRRLQQSEAILHASHRLDARKKLRKRARHIEENCFGDDVAPKAAELRQQAKHLVIPPSSTLANAIAAGDDDFERLYLFEQRLENTIHRSLRSLRQLRKDAEETKDLPASPFLRDMVMFKQLGEMYDKAVLKERAESQKAQNEPTDISTSTPEEAKTCEDFSGAGENPPKATEAGETQSDECVMQNENEQIEPPMDPPLSVDGQIESAAVELPLERSTE